MTDDHSGPFEGKTCFIILPVGPAESGIRRNADGLIEVVLRPELESMGFEAAAAHESDSPGSITRQIIVKLLECDLVVADLTRLNPNVMYELAVRHCKRLPVVTLAEEGTKLPFDVATERTIFYQNTIAGVSELAARLRRAVEAAMQESEPDNPVYRAAEAAVMKSVTPAESTEGYILRRLDSMEATLDDIYLRDKVMIEGTVSKVDEAGSVFVELGGKEFELGGQQYSVSLSCPDEIDSETFLNVLHRVPEIKVTSKPDVAASNSFDATVSASLPGAGPTERAEALADALRRRSPEGFTWEVKEG